MKKNKRNFNFNLDVLQELVVERFRLVDSMRYLLIDILSGNFEYLFENERNRCVVVYAYVLIASIGIDIFKVREQQQHCRQHSMCQISNHRSSLLFIEPLICLFNEHTFPRFDVYSVHEVRIYTFTQ